MRIRIRNTSCLYLVFWIVNGSGYDLELDSGSGWQSVYHGEDTEYQVINIPILFSVLYYVGNPMLHNTGTGSWFSPGTGNCIFPFRQDLVAFGPAFFTVLKMVFFHLSNPYLTVPGMYLYICYTCTPYLTLKNWLRRLTAVIF
jgi:hypothetical protein